MYLPLADLEPGVRPGRFADFRAARAWMAEQRENMLAVLDACAARDESATWQLALVLAALLVLDPDQDRWPGVIDTGLVAARRAGHGTAEAFLLEYAGTLYTQCGRTETGASLQRYALALRERIGDVPGRARSLTALALIATSEQEYPTAMRRLTEALRITTERGDEHFATVIRLNQVAVLTASGRTSEAAALIEAVAVDLRGFGMVLHEVTAVRELARIQAAAGDLDAAQVSAAQAVEQAAMLGAVPYLAGALIVQHDVLAAAGLPEHALQAARQAAAFYRAVGDRRHFALALHRGGALHREGGQVARAEQLEQHAALLERELRQSDARGPEAYLLADTACASAQQEG